MTRRFSGVIAIEGVQTGDGRLMAPDSLTWAELPLPLSWLQVEMHSMPADGIQVGILDSISRADGGLIMGEGVIDDEIPEGAEVVRRLEAGTAPFGTEWGISIDADDFDVEIIDNGMGEDETAEIIIASALRHAAQSPYRLGVVVAAAGDGDTEGDVLMEASADEVIERATRLRIRGATLCAIPAFDGARISLAEQVAPEGELPEDSPAAPPDDEPMPEPEEASVFAQGMIVTQDGEPILASGYPITPPVVWFDDPLLPDPTPLTITEGGRVFGHIATFDRCHVGLSGCTLAPRSNRAYDLFLTGVMRCAEGCEVRVGTLTTGIGHAPGNLNAEQTAAHYDDTRAAAAYVAVGEDEFGIWVAGTVRPDLPDAQLVNLRASKPSGDWRPIQGKHELVAVLCVNAPGYPVERSIAAGGMESVLEVTLSQVPQEVLAMAAERIDRRFVRSLDDRMNGTGWGHIARAAAED